MKLEGKAWKFGDNIHTDHITPERFFHLGSNLSKLADHVFADIDPDFASQVQNGDILVAGSNFGLGASRENALAILKIAGINAILAKSFDRIFFRNAINIGLPVISCDTDKINRGDKLSMDIGEGVVENQTTGETLSFEPLPDIMMNILKDGGLLRHVPKTGFLDY